MRKLEAVSAPVVSVMTSPCPNGTASSRDKATLIQRYLVFSIGLCAYVCMHDIFIIQAETTSGKLSAELP